MSENLENESESSDTINSVFKLDMHEIIMYNLIKNVNDQLEEDNLNLHYIKNYNTIHNMLAYDIIEFLGMEENEVSRITNLAHDTRDKYVKNEKNKLSEEISNPADLVAYLLYRNEFIKSLVKYINGFLKLEENSIKVINFPTFIFICVNLHIHLLFYLKFITIKYLFILCICTIYLTYFLLLILYFSDILSIEEKNSNTMDFFFITAMIIFYTLFCIIREVLRNNLVFF